MSDVNKKFRLLFVCLGNICRSPAAEAVMNTVLERRGLSHLVEIDSAGTADYHIGKRSDERMITAGAKRGHQLMHRVRQISQDDLMRFDLILAMDEANLRNIRSLSSDTMLQQKVRLFLDCCGMSGLKEVPDPYYGEFEGFESVLDLLEAGCENLADWLMDQVSLAPVSEW